MDVIASIIIIVIYRDQVERIIIQFDMSVVTMSLAQLNLDIKQVHALYRRLKNDQTISVLKLLQAELQWIFIIWLTDYSICSGDKHFEIKHWIKLIEKDNGITIKTTKYA